MKTLTYYIILVLLISFGTPIESQGNETIGKGFNKLPNFSELLVQDYLDVELVKANFFGVEQRKAEDGVVVKYLIKDKKLRLFSPRKNKFKKRVKVKVYLPYLFSLSMDDGSFLHSKDVFNFGHFVIGLTNAAVAKINLNAVRVDSYISNSSKLCLKGKCERQIIYSDSSARYSANRFETMHAEVYASNCARVAICSKESLSGCSKNNANVIVRGTPVVDLFDKSSMGNLSVLK